MVASAGLNRAVGALRGIRLADPRNVNSAVSSSAITSESGTNAAPRTRATRARRLAFPRANRSGPTAIVSSRGARIRSGATEGYSA
jgi:hypothetical protein